MKNIFIVLLMRMDEEKFASLYDAYRKTVYSVIFNYVKNEDDTLELMQEVFIALLTKSPDFASDEHIKAWLIRVSINISKNYLRDNRRFDKGELSEDIAATGSESSDDLYDMVLKLPEKYRIPLHLFYYEEYSVKMISDVMAIPESTVKVRLKRGRDLLKDRLDKEEWL